MPTCSDRQLTPAQLADGFSQSRQGVVRAVRPFSGQASPEALVDYINRELFPAVKAGREKLNEVYLQVADNAPSANPLSYFFSESTVNADPTRGRIRLNATPQNTATVLRLSELNAQLQSAVAWLDVMQGSSTTPIGVVTLNDRANPGRFIRWNLNTMTDQGAYWDLGVTVVESSHDNPFVEGEGVVVSFIAGVASGGAVPIPPVATLRQIALVSHVGGNAVSSVSRLAFQDASNVTFSLSTAANAATLFASVNTAAGGLAAWQLSNMAASQVSSITNATDTLVSSGTIFAEAGTNTNISFNNVVFRFSGNSLFGAATQLYVASTLAGSAAALIFSNVNNVSFGGATAPFAGAGRAFIVTASVTVASTQGSIRISAGTTSVLSSGFTFSNSHNISWTMNNGTLVASATVATTQGSISFSDGAAGVLASAVTFQSATGTEGQNVTFGLAGSRFTAEAFISLSAGTTRFGSRLFSFADANNVTFGISTSPGGVPRITATATVAATRELGIVSHIGGNVVSSVSQLAFSNASNVTFSLSTAAGAATLIASVAAGGGGGITAFALSNNVSSVAATGLTFSNANGFSFLLSTAAGNAATLSGSFSTHALAVSAAGASASAGTVVWSNSNNVTFGQAGSTITASVTVASTQGSIRISAGAANNLASNFSFADSNSLSFGLNGSTITASAAPQIGMVSVASGAGTSVSNVTRLVFSNASNVSWGAITAASAITILASVAAAAGGGVALAASGVTASTGTVIFSNDTVVTGAASLASVQNVVFALTGQSMGATAVLAVNDGTNSTQSNADRVTKIHFLDGGGVTWGGVTGTDANGRLRVVSASIDTNPPLSFYRNIENVSGEMATLALSSVTQFMWVSPFQGGRPFPAPMTVDIFEPLANFAAATASNSSYAFTLRGGIYTLNNSTRLSLVNSFSFSFSQQSTASANRLSSQVGARWLQLSTSNWSSSPVFSQGVQYWIASNWQSAGLGVLTNAFGQQAMGFVGGNYRGTFGVATAADISSRIMPMAGVVSTTLPPNTIGSANFNATAEGNASGWNPVFQFRSGVFQ